MPDSDGELLTIYKAGAQTAAVLPEKAEIPFNGEIADVTLTVGTAPAGSDMIVDVLVEGTSIFGAEVGTVFGAKTAQGAGAGWDASSTTLLFKPDFDGGVQSGMTLKCGSEELTVSAVAASSQVDNATGILSLTVVRGANGTTAATHAQGTTVTTGLPRIPAGAVKSSSENRAALNPGAIQVTKGQVVSAQVTQIGSGTAGSDLNVEVFVNRR